MTLPVTPNPDPASSLPPGQEEGGTRVPSVWREDDDLIICKLPGLEEFRISNEGAELLRDQLNIVVDRLASEAPPVRQEEGEWTALDGKEANLEAIHVLQNALKGIRSRLSQRVAWFRAERRGTDDEDRHYWWLTDFTKGQLDGNIAACIERVDDALQRVLSEHGGEQGAPLIPENPVDASLRDKTEQEQGLGEPDASTEGGKSLEEPP